MLEVAAGQLRHPMPFLVPVKTGDRLFHTADALSFRG
jgi:hypothetical protein